MHCLWQIFTLLTIFVLMCFCIGNARFSLSSASLRQCEFTCLCLHQNSFRRFNYLEFVGVLTQFAILYVSFNSMIIWNSLGWFLALSSVSIFVFKLFLSFFFGLWTFDDIVRSQLIGSQFLEGLLLSYSVILSLDV